MAERVGFEPTENFDILDRFQDDSIMTTLAPLPVSVLYYTLSEGRVSTFRFEPRNSGVTKQVWKQEAIC